MRIGKPAQHCEMLAGKPAQYYAITDCLSEQLHAQLRRRLRYLAARTIYWRLRRLVHPALEQLTIELKGAIEEAVQAADSAPARPLVTKPAAWSQRTLL